MGGGSPVGTGTGVGALLDEHEAEQMAALAAADAIQLPGWNASNSVKSRPRPKPRR